MATQKRRVIYFTDREWEEVQAAATREHLTISAFVRYTVHSAEMDRREPSQANIYRGVNTAYSSRPFTPVPKPGRK